MATSTLLRLLSPSAPSSRDPIPRLLPSLLACSTRRRRLCAARCSSSVPPFEFPSSRSSRQRRKNSFVHFVLDPVASSSPKASFAVRYRCLVQIESVQKLELGALVSIRGVCRVNIMKLLKLLQMEPYLHGDVSPIMDKSCNGIELGMKISKLRESMANVHSLKLKLRVPGDEPLQTNIKGSLLWSQKEIFQEYDEDFIPALPERLSFAAYQTVSGMSDAELLTLQKYKIKAMGSTDTLERLNSGIEYVEHNIGMIAARLAIQNI